MSIAKEGDNMNCYKYEEIEVGFSAEFKCHIDESMLNDFKKISGDVNPLHIDDCFARKQNFPRRVAYGMLIASFYSTLAGVYLPGKYCLLQSVNTDFISPVYIDDDLLVKGYVLEKNDSVKRIVIKACIINQHGKKVSKAKIEAGILDENE